MLSSRHRFGSWRHMLPVFIFFLIISSLTGCGQNATPDDTQTPATSADQASPSASQTTDANKEEPIVHVYTARHYDADEALFADFTKETGIEVKIISGKAEELMERIAREGAHTEADVFITVDGGVLNLAKERQLLEPITDETILSQVPSDRRDREHAWVGLSTRARVIVYDKTRRSAEDFSTYDALTDEAWHKKILVRSSTSLYNQSLLASFIALHGRDQAKNWAEGIVRNFARQPEGNDRDQMKALVQGVGDAAIVNTYYIGLLLNSEDAEERAVGERIGVFFPDQETTGTHINISGAGVVKGAPHPQNAVELIRFLTSVPAQEKLSALNYEYPVNPQANWAELLTSWGTFKTQSIDFADLGRYNQEAVKIFTEVGWK